LYFRKDQLFPRLSKESKTCFSFSTNDNQIYIVYEGCIPYCFEGIGRIKNDTLRLDNIKFIKYDQADTIEFITTNYNADSTVSSIKKQKKVIKHRPLKEIDLPLIIINGKTTAGSMTIKQAGMTTNSCTPYKHSRSTTWVGKDVRFEYSISE
jgi:hypothetical protein